MTPLELDNILRKNKWETHSYPSEDGYVLPEKIQYALAASVDNDTDIRHGLQCPYWIADKIDRKRRAAEKTLHQFDPVERNKPIRQLLKDYFTKGKKVQARVELKARIPYASFDEQRLVLCSFLLNVSVDRKFALRYLDTHWDEYYAPFVENAWRDHHEMEAARCITHHFPVDFIETNQAALSNDYLYLQVRLRLPASAPIDREKLSNSAYLYLCARQSIPVTDKVAEKLLFQTLLDFIAKYELNEKNNLLDIPAVSSIIWSLGILRKTRILLRFVKFHQEVFPFVILEQWESIKYIFLELGKSYDFTLFTECVNEREQRKQEYINPSEPEMQFDWDTYVDEHVNAESNEPF